MESEATGCDIKQVASKSMVVNIARNSTAPFRCVRSQGRLKQPGLHGEKDSMSKFTS